MNGQEFNCKDMYDLINICHFSISMYFNTLAKTLRFLLTLECKDLKCS